MVIAPIQTSLCTVSNAHVLWDMKESCVNPISALVNLTLVGTTVSNELMIAPLLLEDNGTARSCCCLGVCNQTSSSAFRCDCVVDWEGDHCERKVNHCENVTCVNGGICRPLVGSYRCECTKEYYYGQHCETATTKIRVLHVVSKSFGYIGISAIILVLMFIVLMDLLKYGFGIDPVRNERRPILPKKRARQSRPIIVQRFIYVP